MNFQTAISSHILIAENLSESFNSDIKLTVYCYLSKGPAVCIGGVLPLFYRTIVVIVRKLILFLVVKLSDVNTEHMMLRASKEFYSSPKSVHKLVHILSTTYVRDSGHVMLYRSRYFEID